MERKGKRVGEARREASEEGGGNEKGGGRGKERETGERKQCTITWGKVRSVCSSCNE